MVARGDIWWYEPPEEKRRPFLILTRDEALPVLTKFVAVPATRSIRDIPTEVRLDSTDGMPADCVLTLDNITTVHRAYLTDRIATLRADRWQDVCEALGFAVVC